jgi:hypothetical protein
MLNAKKAPKRALLSERKELILGYHNLQLPDCQHKSLTFVSPCATGR